MQPTHHPDTTTALQSPDALLATLEDALRTQPHLHGTPGSLYEPMRHLLALRGKRIRPMLVLLAYQAWADVHPLPIGAYQLAVGVELFHNFSLVHDDIMDNAPTRRGQPTVHVHWNTNIAILAGDALFAEAVRMVAVSFPAYSAELTAQFCTVARVVCEGQAEDMDYTTATEVELSAYLEMIRKKTAVLLGGALWLGARGAGAPAAVCQAMYDYGEAAGIAFQLLDDLLDTYAQQSELGKQVGGDIIEGKNTYLWLRAMVKATPAQRQELLRWRSTTGADAEKVAQTRRMFDELTVADDTRALVQDYYSRAAAHIAPYKTEPGILQLEAYMQALIDRTK
jgi:geranylgeranyl diphosphate synthase, type II